MKLSLIVAVSENGIIGASNAIPWKQKNDLVYFKAKTINHAVIMGRKTWESIGKPLPHRTNIVITRQKNYSAPGCSVVHSFKEAIAVANRYDINPFVIGGESIYREALPLCNKLYVTEIHNSYSGNAYFPQIDRSWQEYSRTGPYESDHVNENPYSFVVYKRSHTAI